MLCLVFSAIKGDKVIINCSNEAEPQPQVVQTLSLWFSNVLANLRLPHFMLSMINIVNDINISLHF